MEKGTDYDLSRIELEQNEGRTEEKKDLIWIDQNKNSTKSDELKTSEEQNRNKTNEMTNYVTLIMFPYTSTFIHN